MKNSPGYDIYILGSDFLSRERKRKFENIWLGKKPQASKPKIENNKIIFLGCFFQKTWQGGFFSQPIIFEFKFSFSGQKITSENIYHIFEDF